MLAYVLWHWKTPRAEAAGYEARQRAFHAALAAEPPESFLGSFVVGLTGAAWAASGGEAYEDWYLIKDFAALGHLNAGAVSAGRAAPHDAVAALAGGGSAGLYDLKAGEVVRRPQISCWFRKPEGVTYAGLAETLAPLVEGCHGALWMRQMTLGPAPEYCLHSAVPVTFPAGFSPLAIPLRPVWPEPA